MKKRFVSLVLMLTLMLAASLNALAAEELISKNYNRQNYATWSNPVTSYLYAGSDNTLVRVEYKSGSIITEQYDEAFNYMSSTEIPMELKSFGGFFSGKDYNFFVFGQRNPEQSDSVEVFRIVKYSKTWQRLGSVGVYKCNTTVPFDAGSLRMTEYGDMLYIRSSHEMYKSSDGKNHQSNITFSVSIPDMRVTDIFSGVMNISYGYVSHSFNQFILTSGSTLAAVDHGDAHPRSIALILYQNAAGEKNLFQAAAQLM